MEPIGSICSFLGGIIVSLGIVWFTHVRNAIDRDEFENKISKLGLDFDSKYVGALRANTSILTSIQKDMTDLREKVAVISDRSDRDEHSKGKGTHA